jgi:prolyl-tRNA synthetase
MRLSQSFFKTTKNIPSDETSRNAVLLLQAGFISKTMAGVYAYLPLGLKVLEKIENIVRKHMNSIGGQELLLNSLNPKQWWEKTNRWDTVDILFKLKSQTNQEYALTLSGEEQVAAVVKPFITSYKDLPDYSEAGEGTIYPFSVYQIQTKFRDELRSKAGLMRGRELRMKDLYDFHKSKESQEKYFELITKKYVEIFAEIGLKAFVVDASGGIFSEKFSREFQVICDAGEDIIHYSESTGFAANEEVLEESLSKYTTKPTDIKIAKSAEVGNIYDLGTRFTEDFDILYTDENNQQKHPYMGCHGIGTSRTMGVVADNYNDENGLKWPENIAPYKFHLITYENKDAENKISKLAKVWYENGVELGDLKISSDDILWDDRDVNLGTKLKDADLMGIPFQIIMTPRTIENKTIEFKNRSTGEVSFISI